MKSDFKFGKIHPLFGLYTGLYWIILDYIVLYWIILYQNQCRRDESLFPLLWYGLYVYFVSYGM